MIELQEVYDNPADMLEGKVLEGGWKVIQKLKRNPEIHTGSCFSVGYELEGKEGQPAFLKALDYSRAFNMPDAIDQLRTMLDQYVFERDLLIELCENRKLKRIVRALAHGSIEVPEAIKYPRVDYLIFEMAEGDVRDFLSVSEGFDSGWALNSLKDITSAMTQLHTANVSHQDLKPSNVLVFDQGDVSKLGDVGRAVVDGRDGPFDGRGMIGAVAYAPPEHFYGFIHQDFSVRRYSCDLYHVGSMILFYFANYQSSTNLLFNNITDAIRAKSINGNWDGTYEEVLPYLEHAFMQCVEKLERNLEGAYGAEISKGLSQAYAQLCHPDPKKRGHPKNHSHNGNRYGLERYVSLFNNLSKRSSVVLRATLEKG